MAENKMREDFDDVWYDYYDMVYRMVFIHIKKPDDATDIAQEVFLRYLLCKKNFASDEEKRNWLMRTAHSSAMDYFRTKMRKTIRIKDMKQMHLPFAIDKTLEVLLMMPDRYRTPAYMHYYEGFSAEETAKILHKPLFSVKSNLKKSQKYLNEKLGGEN